MEADLRRTQLVIFDLDGTLSDTLESIGKAVNDTMMQYGMDPHPLDSIRTFIGGGMMVLFKRAAPGVSEQILQEMCMFYQARVTLYAKEDRLYDGIEELLEGLHKRGTKLAIVSNKPQVSMESCLQSLFRNRPEVREWFCAVYGLSDLSLAKPNPTFTRRILEDEGVHPEDAIYVGDSIVDVQTAQAAGLRCIGCAWGLGERADIEKADMVAETTFDLLRMLLGDARASGL
ncbi:Phosphoglycolate phosphatase [Giardia lamblia P15]|uniref:Phosphoglycolate phosphatase n=1 Tax=Giardia intestinalis (strain P15) TaxID=658858 RepID=E1F4P1_GIAIA|nr:Phosphoglycolate phosphatase [Giardia lamblia P15]